MAEFKLVSDMVPSGDQPQAIGKLTTRILRGEKFSTLLGVTGSGKTFTMANVIKNVGKPVLVISHNKTLAAQLYAEFKEFFPENAVHYFVSYYDYYQPEAYIPQRDIYIEKETDINEDIDRLRLAATSALMSRDDVIVVATVSSIYNLGSPEEYSKLIVSFQKGNSYSRDQILKSLVDIRYERNDFAPRRGKFRVRGETIDIFPSYEDSFIHLEFSGDKLERIHKVDLVSGDVKNEFENWTLFPATHFIAPENVLSQAIKNILAEMEERVSYLKKQGKIVEAQRLETRTRYDMELLKEVGYCKGIENYSRHLNGKKPGEPPYTLLDYYPPDFLVFVDESHVTIPQLHSMYNGDRSRKETLIEYGFRLPSALDNRPLKFEEWEAKIKQIVFVSATPGPYEIASCKGELIEQIIRPTGLVDPPIKVEPTKNCIKHLSSEIQKRVKNNQRVLVTTLTKRLAEDLADYLQEKKINSKYLHSEIETIERVQLLRDFRKGIFDVLVGINLLREGLDLPEVSLVAILDADKEGFLRSETALIQTIGRTARHIDGEVILYADRITPSMQKAIAETERRRKIQLEYNKKFNITPKSIKKEIRKSIEEIVRAEKLARKWVRISKKEYEKIESISELEKEMYKAAKNLEFEKAAEIRDTIRELAKTKKRV